MKEAYVSFEIAKLLKQKGFDWPCICYYEDNGIMHEALDYVRQNDGEDDDNDECLCPTQQMACRWLREEKNIYVTAVPDIGNSLRFYPAIYVIKGEIPEEYWFEYINSVVEELHKSYDKPQQAVETALEYVLTNLI